MFDFADDNSLFLADSPHEAIVGAETVPVLYDAPFRQGDLYEGQVNTSAPAISMLDEDVARLHVEYGSRLTVLKLGAALGTFEVTALAPDGLGMTRLTLTKD